MTCPSDICICANKKHYYSCNYLLVCFVLFKLNVRGQSRRTILRIMYKNKLNLSLDIIFKHENHVDHNLGFKDTKQKYICLL